MLTRNSQVGEFYIMGPPEGKIEADSYGFMDILIYDEEADRHVRIKWEHALAATLMVNSSIVPDAEPIYDKPKTMVEDDLTANTRVAWYDAAMAWQKANERQEALATGVPLDGANTTAAMTAKEVEAYWREKAAKANVYIVIARPFIEHMMHSAVVAVGGKDTGATLFGPAGMFGAQPLRTPCRELTNVIVACRHADLGQHAGQDDRGEWRRSAHRQFAQHWPRPSLLPTLAAIDEPPRPPPT